MAEAVVDQRLVHKLAAVLHLEICFRSCSPGAWRLVSVEPAVQGASFGFWLNRKKLREARRREGRYLLRTNLTESDPAKLWEYYLRLVAVEEAFKTLKGDLAIRPIFH
jgi:hypothetical protein